MPEKKPSIWSCAYIFLPWMAGLVCLLLGLISWQSGLFDSINRKLLYKYQSLESAPKDLPLELITIQRTGDQSWPWSSLDYAILLNALSPFSPEVTVLDLPLENGDPMYPIYDMQLANQMGRFRTMLLSSELHGYTPGQKFFVEESSNLVLPHKALRGAASESPAPRNFLQDPDVPLSRVPLTFFNGTVPSLALEAYITHVGADWSKSKVVRGDSIYLADSSGKKLAQIPIDNDYCMLLDLPLFSRKVTAMEFYGAIIAAEELRNGNPDRQGFGEIRKKVVLVGTEAEGTALPVTTTAGKIPAIHVQYQILQQLLGSDYTRGLTPFFYGLILLVGCAAAGSLALLPSRLGSISLLILYMAAMTLASYFSFALARLWWPLFPALLVIPLTWVCIRGIRSYFQPSDEHQPELFVGY